MSRPTIFRPKKDGEPSRGMTVHPPRFPPPKPAQSLKKQSDDKGKTITISKAQIEIVDQEQINEVVVDIPKTRLNLLMKFPTRGRPDRAINCLTEWNHRLSGEHNISWIINIDTDDVSCNNDEFKTKITSLLENVSFVIDNHLHKIHACNNGLENKKFDIVILVSDDMWPVVDKYDEIIIKDMLTYFPNLDGALHYNDGYQKDRISTLTIMGYNLYKYFGYLYLPEYMSFHCDEEYTNVIRMLNKHQYIDNMIVEHRHYSFDKNPQPDALDNQNRLNAQHDHDLFYQRKQFNFYITKPKLSILIPLTNKYKYSRYQKLFEPINEQCNTLDKRQDVEILVSELNDISSVGNKHNVLMNKARGEYVCFLNEDCFIQDGFFSSLLNTINSNDVDCITFDLEKILSEDVSHLVSFNASAKFFQKDVVDGKSVRYIGPMCPLKRDIAQKYEFPDLNYNTEDVWMYKLLTGNNINSNVHIDKLLIEQRL